MRRPRSRSAGVTLIELVMTIVIIAILGALVAPRFMSSAAFQSRGFYDEALAVVRYAQKISIARRRPIFVCVAAGDIRAATDNTCTGPNTLTHPLSGNPLVASAGTSGVTLGSTHASFNFNPVGSASGTVTITFTSPVAGDPARTIQVAAETGYVR